MEPDRVKRGQMGPFESKRGQTGPKWTKLGKMGTNMGNPSLTVSNRAKWVTILGFVGDHPWVGG